jgi:hypothetical protein
VLSKIFICLPFFPVFIVYTASVMVPHTYVYVYALCLVSGLNIGIAAVVVLYCIYFPVSDVININLILSVLPNCLMYSNGQS